MRRDKRPAVRPPAHWVFPQPERARLANGLQVMAFHRPGQHIAAVGLVLDIPLHLEPSGVEGVATVVHRCLDEGTASHPGESFTEALEDTGAVLAYTSLSMLPALLFFIAAEKRIVGGLTGAVKG